MKLETHFLKLSWSNIQDQIVALLYATKAIPEDQEGMSIKLDYAGGFVAQDKIIPVEVIVKKGVEVLKFG